MGFSACQPAVQLIYFACVIAAALQIDHPIYLGISFICAHAYSIKLNHRRGAALGLCLIPCAAAFALWYAESHHFGVTVLRQNFIQNNITLESAAYGMALGMKIACAILWLSCVHALFTTDKAVYLFGRICPRISLFLAILLRMVPRIRRQTQKINIAQCGLGMGANQGSLLRRMRNRLRIFSILITWAIEMFTGVSESMRSRGSGLRGRTAFSIYRFDHRDRCYVIVLFAQITMLMTGVLLRQSYARYAPEIHILPPTKLSCIFYLAYAALCLSPLMLDAYTERRFRRARRKRFDSRQSILPSP